MRNVLSAINLVLLLGLAAYIIFGHNQPRQVYVSNQKLFTGFKGTKELESRLNALRSSNKEELDSLVQLIQTGNNDQRLIAQYQQLEEEFQMHEQALSDQYTADIWKRINVYLADFGKAEGYDFIFGASGDGSLMYANTAKDVTDDAIEFINKKYEDGD